MPFEAAAQMDGKLNLIENVMDCMAKIGKILLTLSLTFACGCGTARSAWKREQMTFWKAGMRVRASAGLANFPADVVFIFAKEQKNGGKTLNIQKECLSLQLIFGLGV